MFKLRLSLIVLIGVLVFGGIVISIGFLTNQPINEVPQITNQYENLEKYKTELEKIIQFNQEVLDDLEDQIINSDDENLEKINEEIAVMKRVIETNKAELEQVISKLSQMEPDS